MQKEHVVIDVERDTMFLRANQSLGLADRPLPQKQALVLKYFLSRHRYYHVHVITCDKT